MTWHEMKWMNEWMNEMSEWMNEWKKERNEWMNERMNEWMKRNEWMHEWKKWMNEWNLPTSSSKSVLKPSVFLAFLCEIELSLQSCAHFADLIFQKWSERRSFLRFLCETELLLQSCALFVNNFCRSRPAPPETETLLWRPRKPLYLNKCRVSRPRAFSNLNSGVPEMFHFPTTWWWCGWHDDVVDMMVRTLAMTIVRSSEVFSLNFLW